MPRSHFVGMVQIEPAEETETDLPIEKAEGSKPTEDVEDPKPSDQTENSEAESILAAIEAKLDSETGSVHSDTDFDDDEDAFERKIKIIQGGFHEVLMAKPAEKASPSVADHPLGPATDHRLGNNKRGKLHIVIATKPY